MQSRFIVDLTGNSDGTTNVALDMDENVETEDATQPEEVEIEIDYDDNNDNGDYGD